jgi:hypothetical protein
MHNRLLLSIQFVTMVREFVEPGIRVESLDNRIAYNEIRVYEGGLLCVSFMARATLYLSMLVDPIGNRQMIIDMSHFNEGIHLEAFLCSCFERHLHNFFEEHTIRGNIVIFKPDKMYEYFTSIKM